MPPGNATMSEGGAGMTSGGTSEMPQRGEMTWAGRRRNNAWWRRDAAWQRDDVRRRRRNPVGRHQ